MFLTQMRDFKGWAFEVQQGPVQVELFSAPKTTPGGRVRLRSLPLRPGDSRSEGILFCLPEPCMEVEGDFIRTEFSHPFILIPVHLNPHQAPRNEQLRMSRSCASVNTVTELSGPETKGETKHI